MDPSRLASFDFYKLAPPVVAILLLLFSDTTSGWLRQLVGEFIDFESTQPRGLPQLANYKDRLSDVAADGATRVSFFSATVAAFASLASLFSSGRQFDWWGLLMLGTCLVFVLTLAWALRRPPGDLVSHALPKWRMTGGQICRNVLLVWNVVLGSIIVLVSVR